MLAPACAGLVVGLGLVTALTGGPGASATSTSTLGPSETTPPAGYLRVEEDDPAVSYTGNWTTQSSNSNCSYSSGTATEATDASAQATFAFTGTAVRWIGYQDGFSGIADVYIDGTFQTSVDTYSLTPVCQAMIFAASGLTSGAHTLTIIATGTHNLASLGTGVWVDAFDYQPPPPPTVTLTAPADGATVSGAVTVSANASASGGSIASVQFKLDGANLGAADTVAPYSVSWDTTKGTNGSHTLTAVATDSTGGGSTSSPVTVTVSNDITPPTVTMTAPANGATVSGMVTVSANATDNTGVARVQFKLDGANLGTPLTAAPYSVFWNTATATNGSHSLTAVATDSAGNTATASPVTVTVSNDTSPPMVSMTAPANGTTVSGSINVSASASDADGSITKVQFRLDGADLGAADTTAPYSVSWDTTAATNGSHTLTAVATDSGGNSTTATPVTVMVSNSTPTPTVSLTAPANGATVSSTVAVSANATESDGSIASMQFKLDGANLGAADTVAPYSVSWDTTTATNGSHTLTAVVTDAGGNSATSSPVTVTVSNGSVDTTPPAVTLTTPAAGATVSGTVTVSANATDNTSVASVQFRLDGADLGAALTTSPYHVSWDTTTAANGSHTLTAVATDPAGNSATATPVAVTVSNHSGGDITPPTVALTSPANGSAVSGSVVVYANASDNVSVASVQFTLDGADLGAAVTTSPYHVSWDTATTTNGNHTLSAVAVDSAANTASARPITVTVSNGTTTTTTRMEENDPAVTYSGNWVATTDASLSGGSAFQSNTANATATLKFTGVAVTWISYRSSETAGIAEVSVDGGAATQVDTYASSPQAQAPVFTASGLKQGPHTLTITVTGRNDPAGTAAYVVLDAFDVTNDPDPPPPPGPGKTGGAAFGLPVLGLLLAAAVRRATKRAQLSANKSSTRKSRSEQVWKPFPRGKMF
ncbi:MAG: beta strand repeat-containing protein [Bacillota bacterium]